MSEAIYGLLQDLANACRVECGPPRDVEGWTVCEWVLSERSISLAVDAYRDLLTGVATNELVEALAERGIDVVRLLRDEEQANDVITRADICELIGGASVVDHDAVPIHHVHFANVPKGERHLSERGIDVVGAILDESGPEDELLPGEFVVICSVKHTVADPFDLRSKLVASLRGDNLEPTYIASQLRLLRDRAAARGIDLRRILLVLPDFPNNEHVRMVAVGAAPDSLFADFITAADGLSRHPDAHVAFRAVSIQRLEKIQDRV